jgi:hypothetical protein
MRGNARLLKKRAAVGAAIALFAGSAHADWSAKKGEDRHTEWAHMEANFDSGLSMFIRCWGPSRGRTPAGNKLLLAVVIGRYDDYATPFEPKVQAVFRTDESGEPIEISLLPAPLNGLFTYGTATNDVAVRSLLKRIGAAKQRIVLSLIGSTHETSALGGAEAAQLLSKTCNLPSVVLP